MFGPRTSGFFRFVSRNSIHRRDVSEAAKLRFTEEQKCQILSTLNSESEGELKKYLGAITLRRVIEHREQHGTFETLEHVLSIDGLNHSSLQSFCRKILVANDKFMALASAITPTLSDERIAAIKNVASMSLDPPFLTYVKMDRECRVVDWRRFTFTGESMKKTKPVLKDLYKLTASFYPKLPLADIFIMDTIVERSQPTLLFEKQMLQAILYTMLSFGEQHQPKVVQVKPGAVANFYNLQMGSDRLSCQNLFEELTQNAEIKLPAELESGYNRMNGVSREFLGLNTLQCLAFLKTLPLHAQLSASSRKVMQSSP